MAAISINQHPFSNHVRHIENIVPDADNILNKLKEIDWYPFPLRKGKNSSRTLCNHNVKDLEVGKILNNWLITFFKSMNIEIDILGMFGNYYPDGNATLPHHQDQYNADIVSLSFGAKRLFHFKTGFSGKVVKPSFYLSHGDMIIFDEYMNENYYHGIPLQKQIIEPRINVTCFVKFTYLEGNNPYTTTINYNNIPTLDTTTINEFSKEEDNDEALARRLQLLEFSKET